MQISVEKIKDTNKLFFFKWWAIFLIFFCGWNSEYCTGRYFFLPRIRDEIQTWLGARGLLLQLSKKDQFV
jgi:hypothetical protein